VIWVLWSAGHNLNPVVNGGRVAEVEGGGDEAGGSGCDSRVRKGREAVGGVGQSAGHCTGAAQGKVHLHSAGGQAEVEQCETPPPMGRDVRDVDGPAVHHGPGQLAGKGQVEMRVRGAPW
jgi:hypothetical protein